MTYFNCIVVLPASRVSIELLFQPNSINQVRHLYWGGQDLTLVSCGQDGAVYQWDVDEAKRLGEFVQKGTAYSCALRSVRQFRFDSFRAES